MEMMTCIACNNSKTYKLPFSSSMTRATQPLEIIDLDVWVFLIIFSNGHHYYLYFTNAYSHFTWFFFLQTKLVVYHVLLQFKAQAELQKNGKIKVLQSD